MGEKEVAFKVTAKDAASFALKQIEKSATKATEAFFSFKEILNDLVGAVTAFSLAALVKDMIELGVETDKTFRQIAANLPTFTEGLAELKDEIAGIADASGRNLEQMQQSALTIAKMGVSSAEELKQQLQAATTLADATGTSVDESAQLLIQLRREFHLTGDEAFSTAAKIASVSQGKVGITELTSAFQASVPIFEKFHIDVDTGVRAIAALVDRGFVTSRAIRSELGQFDGSSLRELASSATIAADAEQLLITRAKEVEESTSAELERTRNAWHEALEAIGTDLQTYLVNPLKAIAATLKDIAANRNQSFAGLHVTPEMTKALGLQPRMAAESGVDSIEGIEGGNIGANSPARPGRLPAGKDEIAAATAEAKLKVELQDLARASEEAKRKTLELAKAQGEDLRIAVEQALAAATGHAAELASQAITDRSEKLAKEVLLNQSLSAAEKERLLNAIRLTGDLDKLQAQTQQDLQKTSLVLSGVGAPGHTTLGDINALMAQQHQLLDDRRAEVAAGKDTHDIDQALLEIDKKRADILKDMSQPLKDQGVIAKQTTQDIRDQAYAIQQAVDGAVQLGEAFGVVSQTLGNVARSLAQITSGIGPLLDQIKNLGSSDANGKPLATIGSVIGAALPVVGAVATLGSTILGLGDASDQAAKQVRALTDSLIQSVNAFADEVEQHIAGYGNTLAQQLDAAANKYQQLKDQIQSSDAGDILKAELLSQLNGLEAERIQQIKDEYDAQQAQSQQDYEVRKLRAEGLAAEADALAFAEQQQREYTKAVQDGADAATLAALKEAQAAEKVQHDQEMAAQAQQTLLNQLLQAEQNQLSTAQQSLQATQQLVQTLASYSKSLVLNTSLTTLSPAGQLTEARAQLQDLYAKALGGDKNAAGQFTQSADAFLQSSRAYNASGAGYGTDFSSVQGMLDALKDKYGAQETVEQQQVDAAQQQVDILKQLLAAIQGGTTAVVDSIRQQAEASVSSVAGVLAQLGALSGTLSTVGQSITSAEHDTLVGDQEAVLQASQNEVDAVNSGASADQIAQLDQIRHLELLKSTQDSYYAQQLIETAKIYGWDSPQVQAIVDLQTKYDAGVQGQIDAINSSTAAITHSIREAAGQGSDIGGGGGGVGGSGGRLSPGAAPASDLPFRPMIPDLAFASGGDFPGGFGLFGEAGPELALAGPARIFTAAQTREILASVRGGSAGPVAEGQAVLADILRDGFHQLLSAQADQAAKLDHLATQVRRGTERLAAK